jgi:5'-nucleotidase
MRILVTNDDGIDSEGLRILARAMTAFGDVVVAAPDTEYSGAGAALGALHIVQPEVHRRVISGVPQSWAVTGPPALCVMFSRLGVFGPPFDLVVSGINPGANVGRSVYHSGTIGAALTARNGGISGVAISQAVRDFGVEGQGWDEMLEGQLWESAATVAEAVVGALVAALPREPVVVNVNVPNLPVAEMKGWRRTIVGTVPPRAMAGAVLEPKFGHDDAFKVKMSWGEAVTLPIETDGGAVENGEVSITFLSRLSGTDGPGQEAAETALGRLLGAHRGPPGW